MTNITFEQVLPQIKALPPNELAKLREYLDEQHETDQAITAARALARAASLRDLSAEYQWIEAHRAEYAGQWVALKGDQLISHGSQGLAVIEAARNAGFPEAFIKLVPSVDETRYIVF